MPLWRLRDYDDDDLDQAIQVWDQSRTSGSAEPVFTVAEVMAAARAGQPAVVAEVGDEVVGMAVARTDGERAWVLLVALASRWRHRGIGSALLADLERRLRSAGVRKICTILPEGATGSEALENSGYTRRDGLVYYEMIEHLRPDQANVLAELGGRLLPPGLWQGLAGMEQEKQIIEQRHYRPAGPPRRRRPLRRPPTQGGHLVRATGNRQNQFRQSDFVTAGLAIRRTVSRPAWPPRHRAVWRHHFGKCSENWPNSTSWCCSSTRSRRSRSHEPAPLPPKPASPTNC